MRVTVRCFAMVRELLGAELLDLEDIAEGTTLEQLRELLAERHEAPDLLRLPLAYAVNQTYAKLDTVLVDGDEVAFIPPISGGSQVPDFELVLQAETLDPRHMEAEARTDHDGAVVTFSGVTRDHNEGERVRGLSYEAYGAMVEKVIAEIDTDARAKFAIGRVRVAHRLGDVPIGEASVLVVVAAAHRGPAFDACRYVMDRLKTEAPIFKREWLDGRDGASRWVGELPEPKGPTDDD